MGIVKDWWTRSAIANYGRAIRATPREIIFNRHLILSAMMYAMCGVPQSKFPSLKHPPSPLKR